MVVTGLWVFNAGKGIGRVVQVVALGGVWVTMDMPVGLLMVWAVNGAVTVCVKAWIGWMLKDVEVGGGGKEILEGVKGRVEDIRRELEYVQREVLGRFEGVSVDDRLVEDVDKVLKREVWNGRISIGLKAVLRVDEGGKKYVAVIRK